MKPSRKPTNARAGGQTFARLLRWGVLLAVLQSAEPAAAATPIAVKGRELHTLTFAKLVVKPKGTYKISVADDQFNLLMLEELRKVGYNVLGGEEAVFTRDESSKARLALGGTLQELDCYDVRSSATDAQCDIGVAWELYDRHEGRVIYKTLTRNRQRVTVTDQRIERDSRALLVGALRSLLSRDRFVKAITKSADTNDEHKFTPATFAQCKLPAAKLPSELESVLDAAVVVRVGDVTGAGFFISPDGYLLTANHVVEGAQTVKLGLHSGGTVEATVVRRLRSSDVALLRVKAKSPRCLPIATTQSLAGTELYVIGSPAGEDLAFSTTRGIVSGKREVDGTAFIQTDASINAGNSGGPFVNANGEVVALASWKVAAKGVEGLGFGVTIAAALQTLEISPGEQTTIGATELSEAGAAASLVLDQDDAPLPALGDSGTAADARSGSTSLGRPIWLATSLAALAGGTAYGLLTYSQYKDGMRADELRPLQTKNAIGWGIAIAGGASLVGYFLTGPSKPAKERTGTQASVGVGFSSIFVQGNF